PDLRTAGDRLIPKETIGIKWERVIDGTGLALHDLLTFQNFGRQRVEFPVSLTFRGKFEDVFTVRGLLPKKRSLLRPPAWKGGALGFVYKGSDGLYRSLTIHFSPAAQRKQGTTAHFRIALRP